MAGDWIKLEHATCDKPEVYAIAEQLGIEPEHTLGCLIRIWVWADQQTLNGNATSVTPVTLDRFTRVAGFAAAMESVGWLVVNESGVEFPGFTKHNGETAKKRAQGTRRVAKHRAIGNGSVTQGALPNRYASVTREEKRREEDPSPPPKPPSASTAGSAGNGRAGNGGGGFCGDWAHLVSHLKTLGVVDAHRAVGAARSNGVPVSELQDVASYWSEVPGRWGLEALHWRIANATPGRRSHEDWPPSATHGPDAERARKQRAAKAKGSHAYRIITEGRRAKKPDEEIEAELRAAGLQWSDMNSV